MPGGFRLILYACLLAPLNHSVAVIVGFHVILVGGNKSSWNNSL